MKNFLIGGTGFVLVICLICALAGYPVMLLTNYLFSPDFLIYVFGTPEIGFWKAFWLAVFAAIMFKGSSSKS